MIECTPKGICSWDYVLTSNGRSSENSVDWMHEEGSIIMEGLYLKVKKQGIMSGRWTLEHNGAVLAQAAKSSVWTRAFEVEAADYSFEVKAKSAFSREMIVTSGSETVALIRPVHVWTRRATIQTFNDEVDFATLSFIFWMVQMIWKRNASGAGS